MSTMPKFDQFFNEFFEGRPSREMNNIKHMFCTFYEEGKKELESELAKEKARADKEAAVVDFYANEKHWHHIGYDQSPVKVSIAMIDYGSTSNIKVIGGKNARQCQQEREEIEG